VNQQILNVQGPVENTYAALRTKTDPVHTSIITADYPLIFDTGRTGASHHPCQPGLVPAAGRQSATGYEREPDPGLSRMI
jgi:hypothetical protein